MSEADHIAVVGGGTIGVAFAIVFGRAGRRVRLSDPAPGRRADIHGEIAAKLQDLAGYDLLREPPEDIAARIAVAEAPQQTVPGAALVIECAPEDLDLKRSIFAEIAALAGPATLLASASSAIPISQIAEGLEARGRCLVAHPGNPPYLLPVVELVPAPFTEAAAMTRAAALFLECGLHPAILGREVEGFVFNRLQGALLREAYCLVRDGVATVEDIDRLVRDGLGLRWSVIGPFETADLNTRGGIAAHAQKLGPAYARMGAERGQHDPWTPDLVARVTQARRAALPLEAWDERVRWRDLSLMKQLRVRQ